MTVRELINNLLDYDMDAEVNFELDLPETYERFDFDFENEINGDVTLQADAREYELVDKHRLEYLEELEDEVR
ncbi:hypothetical protein GCM10007063_05920 [Lentibacillus kapialis]|uniref:Uncharacterized protein n=1 Tax=Lentibacillus kapialis TaxID=340214 RepID=A0A917UU77_9BACI|nr:hypothetical protein [Lentibacillus kapialis]GGJ86237.1 hypothetical protein GCM10007063_05920 [Lentibacillus kapialis]